MTTPREHAFELYLHDIHDLPLLSQEEEQRLSSQLVVGRRAAERLASEPGLPAAERERLQRVVTAGEAAREALVASHLRLVTRLARHYTSRGISLLDLIQEGNLALLQAADHFDPRRGVRFATYAAWWIRHAIARAVAEAGHPIRLPEETRLKLYRLYRARGNLLQVLQREPAVEELATAAGLRVEEARQLLTYLEPVLSLHAPLNDEADAELADVVADPVAELQVSHALRAALRHELEQLLQRLEPDERAVIIRRFGLGDEQLRSRQQVARELGMTGERVQRLEGRALRKLRDPELLVQLRDLMAE